VGGGWVPTPWPRLGGGSSSAPSPLFALIIVFDSCFRQGRSGQRVRESAEGTLGSWGRKKTAKRGGLAGGAIDSRATGVVGARARGGLDQKKVISSGVRKMGVAEKGVWERCGGNVPGELIDFG